LLLLLLLLLSSSSINISSHHQTTIQFKQNLKTDSSLSPPPQSPFSSLPRAPPEPAQSTTRKKPDPPITLKQACLLAHQPSSLPCACPLVFEKSQPRAQLK
jgi:hypothetical protein